MSFLYVKSLEAEQSVSLFSLQLKELLSDDVRMHVENTFQHLHQNKVRMSVYSR